MESNRIDRFKGLALILILIGHNKFFTSTIDGLFYSLYSFHVVMFFMIIGLRNNKLISLSYVVDIIVRYFTPFFYAVLGTWIIFSSIFAKNETMFERIEALILAVAIGTAQILSEATGFQVYWFLPALISTIIFWSLFNSTSAILSIFISFVAIIVHDTIGLINTDITRYIPFGIIPSLYIFIYVIISKYLCRFCISSAKTAMIVGLVLLTISISLIQVFDIRVNIGYGNIYSIFNPINLIISDMAVISGFITLYSICIRYNMPLLIEDIGRNSLIIYLTHSLIFQIAWQSSNRLMDQLLLFDIRYTYIMLGLISTYICIVIGLVLSRFIFGNDLLHRFLFPRDLVHLVGRRRLN